MSFFILSVPELIFSLGKSYLIVLRDGSGKEKEKKNKTGIKHRKKPLIYRTCLLDYLLLFKVVVYMSVLFDFYNNNIYRYSFLEVTISARVDSLLFSSVLSQQITPHQPESCQNCECVSQDNYSSHHCFIGRAVSCRFC